MQLVSARLIAYPFHKAASTAEVRPTPNRERRTRQKRPVRREATRYCAVYRATGAEPKAIPRRVRRQALVAKPFSISGFGVILTPCRRPAARAVKRSNSVLFAGFRGRLRG
jgi:hypothetical protein